MRPWQAGSGRRSTGSSRLVILRRPAWPPPRSGLSGCGAERRCASSRRGAHASPPPSSWWLKLHMAPAARGQGARASDWGGMGHKGRRRALSLLSHVAAAEAHEQTCTIGQPCSSTDSDASLHAWPCHRQCSTASCASKRAHSLNKCGWASVCVASGSWWACASVQRCAIWRVAATELTRDGFGVGKARADAAVAAGAVQLVVVAQHHNPAHRSYQRQI